MTTSPARTAVRLAATAAGLALAASTGVASDSVVAVQRAAADWTRLRVELAKVRADWEAQREALDASIEAMQARVAALETEASRLEAELRAEASTTTAADPDVGNERARAALELAGQRLDATVERLAALRPSLPPRLSESLDLAFRSVADRGLGTADRIQHLATILGRCSAFNRTFTLAEQELAPAGSDRPRLLEVLHVGLSHAYAYDRSRGLAYLGRPGSAGWTWEPRPDSAESVAGMIAVFRQERDPGILLGPVQISENAGSTRGAAESSP